MNTPSGKTPGDGQLPTRRSAALSPSGNYHPSLLTSVPSLVAASTGIITESVGILQRPRTDHPAKRTLPPFVFMIPGEFSNSITTSLTTACRWSLARVPLYRELIKDHAKRQKVLEYCAGDVHPASDYAVVETNFCHVHNVTLRGKPYAVCSVKPNMFMHPRPGSAAAAVAANRGVQSTAVSSDLSHLQQSEWFWESDQGQFRMQFFLILTVDVAALNEMQTALRARDNYVDSDITYFVAAHAFMTQAGVPDSLQDRIRKETAGKKAHLPASDSILLNGGLTVALNDGTLEIIQQIQQLLQNGDMGEDGTIPTLSLSGSTGATEPHTVSQGFTSVDDTKQAVTSRDVVRSSRRSAGEFEELPSKYLGSQFAASDPSKHAEEGDPSMPVVETSMMADSSFIAEASGILPGVSSPAANDASFLGDIHSSHEPAELDMVAPGTPPKVSFSQTVITSNDSVNDEATSTTNDAQRSEASSNASISPASLRGGTMAEVPLSVQLSRAGKRQVDIGLLSPHALMTSSCAPVSPALSMSNAMLMDPMTPGIFDRVSGRAAMSADRKLETHHSPPQRPSSIQEALSPIPAATPVNAARNAAPVAAFRRSKPAKPVQKGVVAYLDPSCFTPFVQMFNKHASTGWCSQPGPLLHEWLQQHVELVVTDRIKEMASKPDATAKSSLDKVHMYSPWLADKFFSAPPVDYYDDPKPATVAQPKAAPRAEPAISAKGKKLGRPRGSTSVTNDPEDLYPYRRAPQPRRQSYDPSRRQSSRQARNTDGDPQALSSPQNLLQQQLQNHRNQQVNRMHFRETAGSIPVSPPGEVFFPRKAFRAAEFSKGESLKTVFKESGREVSPNVRSRAKSGVFLVEEDNETHCSIRSPGSSHVSISSSSASRISRFSEDRGYPGSHERSSIEEHPRLRHLASADRRHHHSEDDDEEQQPRRRTAPATPARSPDPLSLLVNASLTKTPARDASFCSPVPHATPGSMDAALSLVGIFRRDTDAPASGYKRIRAIGDVLGSDSDDDRTGAQRRRRFTPPVTTYDEDAE